MDLIGDLLAGVRAQGSMFCQSIASPPWAIRFEMELPLSVATMMRGEAWVMAADGPPQRIRPGDVVLAKGGGRAYVVADTPGTPPKVIVYGQHCVGDYLELGPNAYGDADGEALLVTGSYQVVGDLSARLLSVLPDLVIIPADARMDPALALVKAEIEGSEPGAQVALDRLLDLLLLLVVRAWFARPEAQAPRWYAALADAQIGLALRMIHDDPSAAWSVGSLAEAVGMSRAAFARRFHALVGSPPLTYVTEWRMELAADLLRRQGMTVAAAARKVGYADPFGFSAAFKRVRGVSPSQVTTAAVSSAV